MNDKENDTVVYTEEDMKNAFQAGNEFGLYMDEQNNFEVNHVPFWMWIKTYLYEKTT